MKLLTKELRRKLPPLYAMEEVNDPLVICKFFLPGTVWRWYAIEFDGEDRFFGYVEGSVDKELGYFLLSDLEMTRGLYGVTVERDLYFDPAPLSVVKGEAKREEAHAAL